MQYWAVLDNERKGPMNLEELIALPISPDTLVWREGLVEWIQAKDLSELSSHFENYIEPPVIPDVPIVEDVVVEEAPAPETTPAVEAKALKVEAAPEAPKTSPSWFPDVDPSKPCPPTYLVFAIITLACCCQVFGIIALVYSSQVTSLYNTGNYEKACKYSQNAMIWSIAALVSGLIMIPVIIGLNLLEYIV